MHVSLINPFAWPGLDLLCIWALGLTMCQDCRKCKKYISYIYFLWSKCTHTYTYTKQWIDNPQDSKIIDILLQILKDLTTLFNKIRILYLQEFVLIYSTPQAWLWGWLNQDVKEKSGNRRSCVGVRECHKVCVRRSMTTIITSLPYEDGRPSTKSIETSVQTWWGTGRGCNIPAGFRCSTLFRWQMRQVATKSLRWARIPSQ